MEHRSMLFICEIELAILCTATRTDEAIRCTFELDIEQAVCNIGRFIPLHHLGRNCYQCDFERRIKVSCNSVVKPNLTTRKRFAFRDLSLSVQVKDSDFASPSDHFVYSFSCGLGTKHTDDRKRRRLGHNWMGRALDSTKPDQKS